MLKIKMLLVYILLSVNISTVIADDNVLTVWEDKGKSLAIVNQIAEFEKNNNCIVKIFEKDAEKQLDLINKQILECRAYDEVLNHASNMNITLDLDDGVKVNYQKMQKLDGDKDKNILSTYLKF